MAAPAAPGPRRRTDLRRPRTGRARGARPGAELWLPRRVRRVAGRSVHGAVHPFTRAEKWPPAANLPDPGPPGRPTDPATSGGYTSARHGTRTTVDERRKLRDRFLVGRLSRRHPARHRPGVRTHPRGRAPAREPDPARPPSALRSGDCDKRLRQTGTRPQFAPASGPTLQTQKALTRLQESQIEAIRRVAATEIAYENVPS